MRYVASSHTAHWAIKLSTLNPLLVSGHLALNVHAIFLNLKICQRLQQMCTLLNTATNCGVYCNCIYVTMKIIALEIKLIFFFKYLCDAGVWPEHIRRRDYITWCIVKRKWDRRPSMHVWDATIYMLHISQKRIRLMIHIYIHTYL